MRRPVPRIPLLVRRETLRAEQQRVFDAIAGTRGAVRGPFGALLHVPEIADAAQQLGSYLRYRSSLPERLRESTILSVAALWRSEFEWAVHAPLAVQAGVDETTLSRIERGAFDELDGEIGLGARLARAAVNERAISDELFAESLERWGVTQVVELVSLIGYYSMLAVVLNSFEIGAE